MVLGILERTYCILGDRDGSKLTPFLAPFLPDIADIPRPSPRPSVDVRLAGGDQKRGRFEPVDRLYQHPTLQVSSGGFCTLHSRRW